VSDDIGPQKVVDFGKPPVVEVALTVQFASPIADIVVLAEFVTRLAKEFPTRTLQPTLPRMSEIFDRPHGVPTFEMRFDQAAGLPRTWLSGDGPYLVQIQPDRLAFNWRRNDTTSDTEYPGYLEIRSQFLRYLGILMDTASTSASILPRVDVCEVFYVNPISVPGHESRSFHPDLSSAVNLVTTPSPNGFLGVPEDVTLQARWRIPDRSDVDRPVGRLYLSASPALEPTTNLPIYLVNLTGHVMPKGDGQDAALEALDVAHEWVVRGFESITTPQMHQIWDHRSEVKT
jgi:uncharacterized protein (TIGR04255 family)